MGLVLREESNNYEKPEAGSVAAVCYGIVDLGLHHGEYLGTPTSKQELMVLFEIDQKMSDGKPFVVNKRYTASLNEKSNLRKDLTAWRAKPFTPEELQGFELKNIIDKPCMLSIILTEKGYVKINAIMPLPKGMTPPVRQNNIINFDLSQLGDAEAVATVYPWVQKIIADSDEGKAFGFIAAEKQERSDSKEQTTYNAEEAAPF